MTSQFAKQERPDYNLEIGYLTLTAALTKTLTSLSKYLEYLLNNLRLPGAQCVPSNDELNL